MPTVVRRIVCRGSGSDLFMLSLGNVLRTILTLGIYEPWGRTRVRRYLWSAVEFAGEPLVYHGSGKELFFGRIKGSLAVFLVMTGAVAIAVAIAFGLGTAALEAGLANLVLWAYFLLGFGVLLCVALVGGRRYRMSRTSWRGIRFSFRARWTEYLPILLRRVLVPFTLGLSYPFVYVQHARFAVSRTYFGNTPFTFHGDARDLFRPWLKALVLTPLTLGLYWFWFLAERHRFVWANTHFGGAQFRSTVDGRGLLGLWLGNLLLIVFTLGVAMPFVTMRRLAFLTEHLVFVGAVDLDAIVQDAQQASAAGEGVAAALDIDSDLGIAI